MQHPSEQFLLAHGGRPCNTPEVMILVNGGKISLKSLVQVRTADRDGVA